MNLIHKIFSSCDGDVAEFGVYGGESASRLYAVIVYYKKKLYLFDSFTGLPKLSKHDSPVVFYEHRFSDTSEAQVLRRLGTNGSNGQIVIYKGMFSDTIHLIKDKRFCFINIDCDLYEGYKLILETLYDNLNVGGVFRLDDYREQHCDGATRAVDEFAARYGLNVELEQKDYYIQKYEQYKLSERQTT